MSRTASLIVLQLFSLAVLVPPRSPTPALCSNKDTAERAQGVPRAHGAIFTTAARRTSTMQRWGLSSGINVHAGVQGEDRLRVRAGESLERKARAERTLRGPRRAATMTHSAHRQRRIHGWAIDGSWSTQTLKHGLARLPGHHPGAGTTTKPNHSAASSTRADDIEGAGAPVVTPRVARRWRALIACPICGRRRPWASLQLPVTPLPTGPKPPPTVDDGSAATAAHAEVVFDARKMRAVEHSLEPSTEPATSYLRRALAARRRGRAAHLPHTPRICAEETRRASGLDNAEHPPGSPLPIHQRGTPAIFARTGTTTRPAAFFVDVAATPAPWSPARCMHHPHTHIRTRARRPNDRAAHPQSAPPPPSSTMRPPAPCTPSRSGAPSACVASRHP
ncbi:hypothetical protein DFH09DRAFT_1454870 [Mycena vulgaris]|nr:hypothetical protein DFH09DRAFT_1454870 [Mycena vulgaris]